MSTVVQTNRVMPSTGAVLDSKCRKTRTIRIFTKSTAPMASPMTRCATVRAGSSTWYAQSRGTIWNMRER